MQADPLQTAVEGMVKRLGLSPFAHVNVGGICGATRLVQLRLNDLGIHFIPMDDKIRKEADNFANGRPVKNSSIYSPDSEWLLWSQCLDAMDRQCAKTHATFKVILFEWMIVEEEFAMPPCPCCGVSKEIGPLVFADQTTKRYIVVQCDDGKRKPQELRNHVRRMAHVLYCMTKYIGYGPEFVRYCVYMKGNKEVPEGITDPKCEPPSGSHPPWGEVNETNFKPALKPRDLSNIDKVLQKDDKVVQRTEKWRKELGLNMRTLKSKISTGADDDTGSADLWFEELEDKQDPESRMEFWNHMMGQIMQNMQQFMPQGDDPPGPPPKPEAKRNNRGAKTSSSSHSHSNTYSHSHSTSTSASASTSKQSAAAKHSSSHQGANGSSSSDSNSKQHATARPVSGHQGANGSSSTNSSSRPAAAGKPELRCASCKRTAKEANQQKLQLCGGCRAIYYCSRDCQRADFKSHKTVCNLKPKGS